MTTSPTQSDDGAALPAAKTTKVIAPAIADVHPPATDPNWREHLVKAEQQSQEDLDKALLSLSGGALGVSFVFLKDIVGTGPVAEVWALRAAWICWAVCTLTVLASYYGSVGTIHRAIWRYDNGLQPDRGLALFGRVTYILNGLGGVLFFLGVLAMTYFVVVNFDGRTRQNGEQTNSSKSPAGPAIPDAAQRAAASTRVRTSEPAAAASGPRVGANAVTSKP